MSLEIIYEDQHLIAINKPHGLLVHRSKIAEDASEFALQMLRDQIGRHVFLTHRIDRKTAGVLLFALDKDMDSEMQQLFSQNAISKEYLAIVRGYTNGNDIIDYALKKENGRMQKAFTAYETMARSELPVSYGKHSTSRYSLVLVRPKTGRMHQIRKHFKHVLHPIIGDRPHGCNKQNRLFKEKWNMDTMLLHALRLSFQHPVTQKNVIIQASVHEEFRRMIELMGWLDYFNKPDTRFILK